MLESTSPGALRVPAKAEMGFTLERLEWLVRLRWMALLGIVIAATFAAAGAFPGVNVQVLFATAFVATLYNTMMWRDLKEGRAATDQRAAIQHALIDFMLLTVVLWAAGGLESPFVTYYVFHVTLVGILFGPRATRALRWRAQVSSGRRSSCRRCASPAGTRKGCGVRSRPSLRSSRRSARLHTS